MTPEEQHAHRLELARNYLICKVRGHAKSGMSTASVPPQEICKFCGTHYWWTKPELREGMGKPTVELIAEAQGFSSWPKNS